MKTSERCVTQRLRFLRCSRRPVGTSLTMKMLSIFWIRPSSSAKRLLRSKLRPSRLSSGSTKPDSPINRSQSTLQCCSSWWASSSWLKLCTNTVWVGSFNCSPKRSIGPAMNQKVKTRMTSKMRTMMVLIRTQSRVTPVKVAESRVGPDRIESVALLLQTLRAEGWALKRRTCETEFRRSLITSLRACTPMYADPFLRRTSFSSRSSWQQKFASLRVNLAMCSTSY